MTLWIGIDPGIHGAIAAINDQDEVTIFDPPTEKRKSGKVNRSHYLPAEMRKVLGELLLEDDCCGIRMNDAHIIIEDVHSRPTDGVVQAFSLGNGKGLWVATVHGFEIAPHMVAPQTWKKKLGLTQDKEASRFMAMSLYPSAARFLTRKKDEGRAEALLLAHYLRMYGNV